MCMASLEGWETRKAKKGETLYSLQNHGGAFAKEKSVAMNYSQRTSSSPLVCIPYGTKCTLIKLQLDRMQRPYMADKLVKKEDKTHVVTLVRTLGGNKGNGDMFKFADGVTLFAYMMRSPIYIGVKAKRKPRVKKITGKVGVAVIEKAIKEAIDTTVVQVRPHLRRKTLRIKKVRA